MRLFLFTLAPLMAFIMPACSSEQENDITKLQHLAEKGDMDAQFNLGLAYFNGDEVPQDSVKAREWWMKAAEQGDAITQFNLGVM